MFDILGKAIGGLTQLAQEKLLFDFLRSDPGMAIFVGGVAVIVLIIVPIGPAWLRAGSWIGKGIAGAGAIAMMVGILVLGIDYSISKVQQLHKTLQDSPKSSNNGASGGTSKPAPVKGTVYQSEGG